MLGRPESIWRACLQCRPSAQMPKDHGWQEASRKERKVMSADSDVVPAHMTVEAARALTEQIRRDAARLSEQSTQS